MATEKYPVGKVVEAIHETRGLVTMAAKRLRCDPDTIRNYAARHPTVAAALKEERDKMTDIAELALFTELHKRAPWAVCFYLKTQGKDRGYIERQEVSGPDGRPIEHMVAIANLVDLAAQAPGFSSDAPALGDGRNPSPNGAEAS